MTRQKLLAGHLFLRGEQPSFFPSLLSGVTLDPEKAGTMFPNHLVLALLSPGHLSLPMIELHRLWATVLFSLILTCTWSQSTRAQTDPQQVAVFHRIEGRVHFRTDGVGNLRVRLVREMRPIAETFTRPEGQFSFSMVREGDYQVETVETDKFEASSTSVLVRPLIRQRPDVIRVFIDLELKPPPERVAPGVVLADVDLDIPKDALKHYRAGMKALDGGDAAKGVKELQGAVETYTKYYAARLALGQELRRQKRYEEAAEVLQPLGQIAPRRAAPRIAYGAVLLALGHRDAAIEELRVALNLDESNWEGHFYLGWALLEIAADKAEPHLKRALELDEPKAVRAHLALARLAHSRGERQTAIKHLDAFLASAPTAQDAESARRLAERLRSSPQ